MATQNLTETLTQAAIELLKKLIATPSFSKEENETATIICDTFTDWNVPYTRHYNNVWAKNKHYNKELPTIMLNSHHDTVKPNAAWTKDPFAPMIENGKLYGLGSNDAGASLVSLWACFMYFYHRSDLAYNILFVASAEEEITGSQGLELLFKEEKIKNIDLAIVGEPTQMQMAIAEKGLMVVDAIAHGKAGHAAREEGINAIYLALDDINFLRNYSFEKTSPVLGAVKTSVTIIGAGSQHNVVPDTCTYTIDVRVNECYTLAEVFEILQKNLKAELKPRSMRLQPSGIAVDHKIVQSGLKLGLSTFGSPTISDQTVIPYPSIKIGPGHSARSHTANEYIEIQEIEQGVETYIKLLNPIVLANHA